MPLQVPKRSSLVSATSYYGVQIDQLRLALAQYTVEELPRDEPGHVAAFNVAGFCA